jgi:hypothetical protein
MSAERDKRISEIFYYFEEHTDVSSGRTVGRKIGVVQEIIVRKHLLKSPLVADRIVFEPSLMGASGASHKVEFVLVRLVEVVAASAGETVKLGDLKAAVSKVDRASGVAYLVVVLKDKKITVRLPLHGVMPASIALPLKGSNLRLKLSDIAPDGRVRLSLLKVDEILASIESKRVGAQRFSSSNTLGSGIQTIEKAKQAALAALDIGLKQNGTIKPLAGGAAAQCLSFVVLGNGVHWTEKDKNILGTYVDYTYLVGDKSILRYADFVREDAKAKGVSFFEHFMGYFYGMTKTPDDAFAVSDDDFQIVVPAVEKRSLMKVIEDHVRQFNNF